MYISDDFRERAKNVRLIAMDVDGVMTGSEIIYTGTGEELKIFNVKDGLGISMAIREGYQMAIVTGRISPIVDKRAGELSIHHVIQAQKNKMRGIEMLVEKTGIPPEEMAYIGDDLPDMSAMTIVGLAACPADAVDDVKKLCHYICEKPGGKGAVREFIEAVLNA